MLYVKKSPPLESQLLPKKILPQNIIHPPVKNPPPKNPLRVRPFSPSLLPWLGNGSTAVTSPPTAHGKHCYYQFAHHPFLPIPSYHAAVHHVLRQLVHDFQLGCSRLQLQPELSSYLVSFSSRRRNTSGRVVSLTRSRNNSPSFLFPSPWPYS